MKSRFCWSSCGLSPWCRLGIVHTPINALRVVGKTLLKTIQKPLINWGIGFNKITVTFKPSYVNQLSIAILRIFWQTSTPKYGTYNKIPLYTPFSLDGSNGGIWWPISAIHWIYFICLILSDIQSWDYQKTGIRCQESILYRAGQFLSLGWDWFLIGIIKF